MNLAMLALRLVLLGAAPDAEQSIEQARVELRELREEQALALLSPLLEEKTLPPPLRARAHVYAALALQNLDQEIDARARFVQALEIDPAAALPNWASRRVRAMFDELVSVRRPAAPALASPAGPVASLASGAPASEAGIPRASKILWGAAATLTVASACLFWRSSAIHARADGAPGALEAARLDKESQDWWYAGVAVAAAGVAAGASGVVTWGFAPAPAGGAVVAAGRF